jgi:predicted nucleic acid-binding protein
MSAAGKLNKVVDCLIDTGAMLAILNARDIWNTACSETFIGLSLPLITSEAVLAELFHLAGKRRVHMENVWKFIHSVALTIGVIQDTDLPAIHTPMKRYADRPMDFADATLVHLAKRERLSTIFTVDHADFATYRIDGKRQFQVVPAGRV